jgi:hypothetical protein
LTVRPTDLTLVGMVHRRTGVVGTVCDDDSVGESGMGMTEVMGRQNRNKEQRQID